MSMFRKVILATAIAASMMLQPAIAATVPDVKEALTQWVKTVETGNTEQMLALYDKDAIMFSVFAVKPLETPKALHRYYDEVYKNPDRKVVVTESYVRMFGNVALNSGLYTLSYKQDNEPVVIPSRFSFTYVLKDGKWVIIEHHSSKVPLAE
jgi:uncharacterized protein (TIGR02246 family)